MFQLLHCIGSKRWHLIIGALTLAALLTVPATPAQAQELVVLEGEETEDSDSPTARADRDSSQRLKVKLVGTLSSGGATGSRVGTVRVSLSGEMFAGAYQTYEVELPGNASRSSKDRFLSFVRGNHGLIVYLGGHLHGASPRNVMHVTRWSSSHLNHSMERGGPHPLDRFTSQLRWNPGS